MAKIKINPFTGKFDFDSGNFLGIKASAPTGKEGYFYINSGDNKLYIYYGGTWQELHVLVPAVATYLLMEDDGFLLMEDDGKLVLEA